MNQLAARDALTSSVKRVSVDERAGFATPSVFAVFETDDPDAALMGLVTLEHAARFSQRIFADLLPKRPGEPVGADADLETVSAHLAAAATNALAVLDSGGHLLGAVTRESLWAAMLTQQRALLAELATREAQQRAVLNAIPDELLWVSAEGTMLPIRAAEQRDDGSGVPGGRMELEDSGGKRLADVFSEDAALALREGIQQTLASGMPGHAAFTTYAGDVSSQYEARFVSWGDGNVLIICRNVTEVNTLRAKLVMSDRMVSIGTLAAGVAHEINNPLTYISANLMLLGNMLESHIADDGPLREAGSLLEDMRDGVDRVQRTVRDLKLFSRSEELSRTVVDVQDVLGRVLRIANNEIRHRASLVLRLDAIPSVDANDSQLGQVFLNLLVNAAQCIPEGAADGNEISVVTRTDGQGRAVVEIHDTGSGIPEEIKSRIFAPFFTTKGVGVGTGLGLSICHGIIVAHGGEIEVASTVGKGSVFRVVLPASTSGATGVLQRRPAEPAVPAPRPNGRFLVVDDESAILTIYRRLLGAEQCVFCTSGREAIALLRQGQTFDAILCDLMMPQMSGMDVYDELAAIAPGQAARMIFVTGGAFTDRARQFLAARTNPTVEKPFGIQQLFDSIAIARSVETH
jgi:signal transduction histidine kinase/CheY-like chemotaxis protein